jgi:hypothetical protein
LGGDILCLFTGGWVKVDFCNSSAVHSTVDKLIQLDWHSKSTTQ